MLCVAGSEVGPTAVAGVVSMPCWHHVAGLVVVARVAVVVAALCSAVYVLLRLRQ